MSNKKIISILVAIALGSGGLAFAQDSGYRNDRGRNEYSQRGERQDYRDNDRSNYRENYRGNYRNNAGRNMNNRYEQERGNGYQRRDERGAGPHGQFRRGGRLTSEYRHRQYVVNDWRGHYLSAPPRGYHWVQTGQDYVLVAIATGVILQLFLAN